MALLPTLKRIIKSRKWNLKPAKEQSWKKIDYKKSEKIEKKQIKIEKYDVITLDALPADCANYGIYNLENKPDLVISKRI